MPALNQTAASFPLHRCFVERFFRTAYLHQLADVWFPAVDGLLARLERGARVADIGCGHGVPTILMGQRWPASSFHRLDNHEASIITARARAIEAGSPPNVSFQAANPPTTPDAVEFSVRLVDGVIVVAGEVDLGTAYRVRGVLAIAAHRYERVTVDLSAVTYLDSCGIAVLVGYAPTGLDVVVAPGSSAARILRVTGLDQMLTVREAGDDVPTRLLDG